MIETIAGLPEGTLGFSFSGRITGGDHDTVLGLRHWKGFERIAVVTDVTGLRTVVRAMGVAMPCPILLFDAHDQEEARRWLSESLGGIQLESRGGVIRVRLRTAESGRAVAIGTTGTPVQGESD